MLQSSFLAGAAIARIGDGSESLRCSWVGQVAFRAASVSRWVDLDSGTMEARVGMTALRRRTCFAKIGRYDGRGVAEPMPRLEGRELRGHILASRYRIVELIGEGAMGEVWRGVPVEGGASVAIKIIHASLCTNATAVGRFKSEVLAASRLIHPNTVRVFDFGEAPGKMLYMVMEHLQGQNLSTLIERLGRLSERRTLAIGVQILDALVAAHQNNIVHRDLKPDNVMLVKSGSGEEQVKVLDFGIAKLLDTRGPNGPTGVMKLTRAGVVVGTPAYMSPEQATGERIDFRSDIFSVGVTLYHMITGERPFAAQSLVGLLRQVITVDPPRASSCISTVDPRIDAIIHRALEKRADRRFQTARAMRSALQEVIDSHDCGIGLPLLSPTSGLPPISAPHLRTEAAVRRIPAVTPPPSRLTGGGVNIDAVSRSAPVRQKINAATWLALLVTVGAIAFGFTIRGVFGVGPSAAELSQRVDTGAWGAAESYALEHFDFFAASPDTDDLVRRTMAMRRAHFADVWRQNGVRHSPTAIVEPGKWRGDAKFPGRPERYRFMLVIESVTASTVRGYSDWPGLGVRVKTEGFRDGNHLLLWDSAYLFQGRRSLGFTLYDKMSLFLQGDRLVGFDGPYRAVLEARRVPTQ